MTWENDCGRRVICPRAGMGPRPSLGGLGGPSPVLVPIWRVRVMPGAMVWGRCSILPPKALLTSCGRYRTGKRRFRFLIAIPPSQRGCLGRMPDRVEGRGFHRFDEQGLQRRSATSLVGAPKAVFDAHRAVGHLNENGLLVPHTSRRCDAPVGMRREGSSTGDAPPASRVREDSEKRVEARG